MSFSSHVSTVFSTLSPGVRLGLKLGLLSLFIAGCDLGLQPAEPEPRAPEPRRLYAPGASEVAEPNAAAAPASSAVSDAEALRAALLGMRPPEEEEDASAKAPKAAPPAERRSARRTASASAEREAAEPGPEDAQPGLSDGAFQSVITDWTGMKRCLATNAARLPTSSGALRVAFTIRGDGQVVESRVVETSNDVARLIAPCVEQRAKRIRFPAFAEAQDEVEKTAKFVF